MSEEANSSLIRGSYAVKLTLSLVGVVGIVVGAGLFVYFEAAGALGAESGVIGSSILGLILLTVISLALIGVTIGSQTIISLRHLSEKADRMADGELDVKLETNRQDEIGQLYQSFDSMRRSLKEEIAAAEEAKENAETARRRPKRHVMRWNAGQSGSNSRPNATRRRCALSQTVISPSE